MFLNSSRRSGLHQHRCFQLKEDTVRNNHWLPRVWLHASLPKPVTEVQHTLCGSQSLTNLRVQTELHGQRECLLLLRKSKLEYWHPLRPVLVGMAS